MRRTLAALALVRRRCPLQPCAARSIDTPAKPQATSPTPPTRRSIPAGQRGRAASSLPAAAGIPRQLAHTQIPDSSSPPPSPSQPAAGVKPGDPSIPPGQPFSFSFDPNEKIDVYAGAFTVKLPVVATPGAHTMDATLKYQACDNASCYPPATLPVKIIFTAK